MATESDNVNSGALGTLLAVGLCSVIGIAFVVTALVRAETAEELEKKEVSADRPYRDLVADQGAKMSAPAAYVDRGRGLVSLPIDRAMEVVVAGLKKDPNSATPPAPIGGSGGAGGSAATEAGGSGGSGGATAEMGGTGGTGGSGGAAVTETETKPTDEAVHAEKGKEKGGTKPHASAGPVTAAPAPAIPLPPPVPASPSPNEK